MKSTIHHGRTFEFIKVTRLGAALKARRIFVGPVALVTDWIECEASRTASYSSVDAGTLDVIATVRRGISSTALLAQIRSRAEKFSLVQVD